MEPAVDEAAAAAAAAAGGSGLLRIFVGGLSTSVTAADMEKTFSPMGRIAGVDFVRTNGRSFAYMDFDPASDRALAKLFSTYNGCIWKGGKLKLEKAKEHYLTRLKKEWEENANANLAPTTPANPTPEKSTGPPKKLDLLKQENMQLKIFFPNLRKVKSVPFKGTGKHKYSFQRIEVPPLPIHFCDCEEHCGPYEMSRERYQSSFDKVINEKELDVMNSVMNKLLEKEGNKKTVVEPIYPAIDAIDIVSEDPGTDEDNIVTNIGMGGNNDILMNLKGRQTQSPHQETRFRKLRPSEDRFTKNKANSDKRKNTVPTTPSEVADGKRSYPVSILKPTEDEFTPILSRKVHFQEPEIVEEAPPVKIQTETEIKTETFESGKGNSWLQKSSWKDLVGEKNNVSFSISHLLSDNNSMAPKMKTNDPDISVSSAARKRKVKFSLEEPRSMPVLQDTVLEKATGLNYVGKSKEGDQIKPNNEGDVEAKDYTDVEPRSTVSKKRKANSRKDERSSQPVSPIITLEKTTRLNHVEISKEGDGIEANLKGAKEAQACDDAEHKRTEDELITVSPEIVADDQSEPSQDTVPSKQGNCWQQKSSWKDLLGGSASSSFTISSILPDIDTSSSAFTISTAATTDEDKSNCSLSNQITPVKKAVGLREKSKMKDETLESSDVNVEKVVGSHEKSKMKDETLESFEECELARENDDGVARRIKPKVGSSKGSSFMRSEESLREWRTVKQALSGFITNKNVEKNTSKGSKGMPSWKGSTRRAP